jgi:hypothetical protein
MSSHALLTSRHFLPLLSAWRLAHWLVGCNRQLASTVARRIDTALTTVSISNADHEGWLAKRRELIDEYKQRYLLLSSHHHHNSKHSTHSLVATLLPIIIIIIIYKLSYIIILIVI